MRSVAGWIFLGIIAVTTAVQADVMDDTFALRQAWDEALLDLHGDRAPTANVAVAETAFTRNLHSAEAQQLWSAPIEPALGQAGVIGTRKGRLQLVLELEMLDRQHKSDLAEARKFRALIQLPKHADAIQGTLALQRSGGAQTDEISRLLAREALLWNGSLAREMTDGLRRSVAEGKRWPSIVEARSAEIAALAAGTAGLLTPLNLQPAAASQPLRNVELEAVNEWSRQLLAGLPNLLSPEDVIRRERLLMKLLRLAPIEYAAGVRDGEIIIPIEYREAKTFTVQSRQLISELEQSWLQNRADAWSANRVTLEEKLQALEDSIDQKAAPKQVEQLARDSSNILGDALGLAAKRSGRSSDVIVDTAMEVRELLKESLRAAVQSRWREADSLRLEAYTTFDLEIEARVLPRDPDLAVRAERLFLDGFHGQLGIKAALDQRAEQPELESSYAAALNGVDECVALLKVGLSPATAIYTTISIVAREGLEAVVILAALLAGLRGAENRRTRRLIGTGAWLAIAAAALTFVVSRFVIESLSRYGEKLEAVVSVLAVVILLMVTNWVFHKVYWTGWNAKLRSLSKAVDGQGDSPWAGVAMVGVGFLTIYREGFETVLFLQSLLLEAGVGPVLIGVGLALLMVGTLGFVVFVIGRKLPYRKMLVLTGVLVVTVLVTFLGSTVRLFQTVGWMPIHPIMGLDLPAWMGVWFGLYPSWEGLLIPPLGLGYVGGAWLFVKVRARLEKNAEDESVESVQAKTPELSQV